MATRKAAITKVVTTEAESLNAELSSDISKLSETALKSFKRAIDQRLTQLEQEDAARKERDRIAAEKAAKVAAEKAAEKAHKDVTAEIDRITNESNKAIHEAKNKIEKLIHDFRETHDRHHDYYISAYIGDAEYSEGEDRWVTSSY